MSDEEVLERLIRQYQNLIYSICYRLTGDYFDAEDLAQDTFLSAYKNLSRFDGANERAWLCRIATNKCIDYLKRAGRRSVPTADEYFTAIPDGQSSPEDACLERDIKKRLYDCCCQLSLLIRMWRWIIITVKSKSVKSLPKPVKISKPCRPRFIVQKEC